MSLGKQGSGLGKQLGCLEEQCCIELLCDLPIDLGKREVLDHMHAAVMRAVGCSDQRKESHMLLLVMLPFPAVPVSCSTSFLLFWYLVVPGCYCCFSVLLFQRMLLFQEML